MQPRLLARPAILALLAACAAGPRVEQIGAMRAVLAEGRSEGRVRLAAVELGASTVAVGALAGLAGEVTIHGDRVWLAVAGDEAPRHVPLEGHEATLLTVARAARFDRARHHEPLDEPSLRAAIERRLAALGDDPAVPRPIVLEGTFTALDLHVIRGACPHQGGDPAHAPWRAALAGARATLVGFYAPGQAGVMTHHDTAFHLHAIVESADGAVTGHVDRFAAAPGAVLAIGR